MEEAQDLPVREQMEEVRKTLREFQELLDSTGWARLVEVLEGQIAARVQLIRQPAEGFDGLVKQEFAKGEAAALELCKLLPERIVEDFQQQLDELKEEVKEDG